MALYKNVLSDALDH